MDVVTLARSEGDKEEFKMVDFVIGCLFLGVSCLLEKHERVKPKKMPIEEIKQDGTYEQRKGEWLKRVTDKTLENLLERQIYNMEDYEQIWKEVKEAYDEMPWKKEKDKYICLCADDVKTKFGRGTYSQEEREKIAASHRQEALRIMMAKRGKLRFFDALHGIEYGGCGVLNQATLKEWDKECADLVLWVDSKLKEHGVNEELYIILPLNEACRIEDSKYEKGAYRWKPAIQSHTQLKNRPYKY